ncbi:hypothetical protein CTI12_AA295010 [Artemisia annua]|uniref:Uncharacterized protein n=1 Tax=Artemisia annua TaxID=35608 RepID=A0A2U1N8F9_ARTAN|nr:hypothetical protein CTI12_AA295010 [Artemisia annua]
MRKVHFSGKVITLDMGLLVAGTKYHGDFEERLKKLMEEIKQSDEIILFIDVVNILKPDLAKDKLQASETLIQILN